MTTSLESILGVKAEDLDAAFAVMSPLDVVMLADAVDRLLADLEGDDGAQVFEAKLPNKVGNVVNKHFGAMDAISKDLEDGKITLDQFNRKAHKAINDNFTDAYKLGRGKALDAGDKEYIRRAQHPHAEAEARAHVRGHGRGHSVEREGGELPGQQQDLLAAGRCGTLHGLHSLVLPNK